MSVEKTSCSARTAAYKDVRDDLREFWTTSRRSRTSFGERRFGGEQQMAAIGRG